MEWGKIVFSAPLKELIGFSNEIRNLTKGRAIWFTQFYGFKKVPLESKQLFTSSIRKRNGLPEI